MAGEEGEMARETLESEVLDCGCLVRLVIEDGRKNCEMIPCHVDCVNFHYAMNHATVSGKPIELRTAP
jgi:hypothetical protein